MAGSVAMAMSSMAMIAREVHDLALW